MPMTHHHQQQCRHLGIYLSFLVLWITFSIQFTIYFYNPCFYLPVILTILCLYLPDTPLTDILQALGQSLQLQHSSLSPSLKMWEKIPLNWQLWLPPSEYGLNISGPINSSSNYDLMLHSERMGETDVYGLHTCCPKSLSGGLQMFQLFCCCIFTIHSDITKRNKYKDCKYNQWNTARVKDIISVVMMCTICFSSL